MKSFLAMAWLVNVLAATPPALAGAVGIVAAPAGEELSRDYSVPAEGKDVPVYLAKVAPADPVKRWKAMDDKAHSAEYFDHASFAYFDMDGPVTVTMTLDPIISCLRSPQHALIRHDADAESIFTGWTQYSGDLCARRAGKMPCSCCIGISPDRWLVNYMKIECRTSTDRDALPSKGKAIFVGALACWLVLSTSAITVLTWPNPRVRATVGMGWGLILLWIGLCGALMRRFREPIRAAVLPRLKDRSGNPDNVPRQSRHVTSSRRAFACMMA